MFAPSAFLRSLCKPLLALLFCAGAGHALGAATVGTVTVNGATPPVTIERGGAMTVSVTVSLNTLTPWQSTRIATSSTSVCSDLPNVTTNGTHVQAFNVNAPATVGTYNLAVTTYAGPGCTVQTATRTLASAIRVDTFPVVLSIVRTSPNPTNTSPVKWTVTFDRQVTGVTLSDFDFAAIGVTGLSLAGTYNTGDTDTYFMETTNTGSGTLGLNVVDDDSIVGTNGLPLGGVGDNNGNFTGQVYTIDRTGPDFPSVSIVSNNATSNQFARTGERATITFTTDGTTSQNPTATINGVAATITGSGNNWTASRVLTASDAEGPVVFRLSARDSFANFSAETTTTNGTSVTIDRTAPVPTITCTSACGTANPVPLGQVRWNVTFAEPVTGVAASNFTLSGAAAGGASIASVSGSAGAYVVVVNAGATGVLELKFSQNLANVRDRAGNSAGASSNPVAANSYTLGGCSLAAGGACTLDAVEAGGAPGSPIFTKRVGAEITLDILAVDGTALNTYSSDTVTATLVVANNAVSCGTVELADPVSFTFAAANAGRARLTFAPKRVARDARVRLVSGGVIRCSKDNFALRPDSFGITSDAKADASGTSPSATPVFKAGGEPFSLKAASSVGYDGFPKLKTDALQAASGKVGVLAGASGQAVAFGQATATTGFASSAPLTYSEVGYFRFRSWVLYDDGGFAAVDSGKSPAECFSDANLTGAAVPVDPNIAVGGKLGCYFGNVQSAYFGRFIPNHFALSAGAITNRTAFPTCAAAKFTYMGEMMAPTFVLTAQNAAKATTVNYTGDFARLDVATQLSAGVIDDPAAPGARRLLAQCTATATEVPEAPCLHLETSSGTFTEGVSSAILVPLTVRRPATAVPPLAALKVGVAPIDSDGVRIATYNLDTVNLVAGTANRAQVGSTVVPYGRLQIDNAYGSELLNLSMKISAQYWNGSAYVTNIDDSCTPLPASAFAMDGYVPGIAATNMKMSNLVGGAVMKNGAGRVLLTKPVPAPSKKGSVVLKSLMETTLPGSGRATFGVYKSGPVIYVRETY